MFDAVSLDYKQVTVITDATAAATPDIHIGMNYLIKIPEAVPFFVHNFILLSYISTG